VLVLVVLFDPHPTGDTARKTKNAPNANRKPSFLLEVFVHIAMTIRAITMPYHRLGALRLGLIHGALRLKGATAGVIIVRVEMADVAPGVTELGEK
jgi:hypothetical protein